MDNFLKNVYIFLDQMKEYGLRYFSVSYEQFFQFNIYVSTFHVNTRSTYLPNPTYTSGRLYNLSKKNIVPESIFA